LSDPIHTEQTGLLATGLNTIVVVGGVTPVTAISFAVASAPSRGLGPAALAVVWFGAGAGLHWTVRRVLRSLRP